MFKSNNKLIVVGLIFVLLGLINADRIIKIFNSPNQEVFLIRGQNFKIKRVESPAEREKGLSGKAFLPKDEGLLFVFETPGRHGFWMKDMNFPIDIIWLNQDKKIIGFSRDLQPESYPKIFYPPSDILYALEVNAGIIK